jgi:hypothetical protein
MAEAKFKERRTLREITVTLDYTDTSAVELFTLPKSARIVDFVVNVRTAFSGGTTTLDVGKTDDTDYFIDGLDVSSVGKAALSTSVVKPGEKLSDITTLKALVGAGNSAGSLRLTCVFSVLQETPMA